MITRNKIGFGPNVMYDVCGAIDEMKVRHYQATGGIGNESEVIADTFLIMFANQYVDTYIYETIDKLKENKKLYRFEVKKTANEILKWLDAYNKLYYNSMSKKSQYNVADMGVSIESALDNCMDGLTKAVSQYVDENYTENKEFMTRLFISIMLVDWAVVYMKSRIKESLEADNPIIMRVAWMSHEGLSKLVYKLDSLFKTPDKIKDIRIYSKWCEFQKLWCDAGFIADNLGESQPDDYVDGSSCQLELSEIYSNKHINKI